MNDIDPTLQLAVEEARKALTDFDYQTKKDRTPLVQALDDAQKAISDAVSAVNVVSLNNKVTLKNQPTPVTITPVQ